MIVFDELNSLFHSRTWMNYSEVVYLVFYSCDILTSYHINKLQAAVIKQDWLKSVHGSKLERYMT